MYRTSSYEPRYKRSTRDRESRHVELWEPSEGSTSEEEEDSTDRCYTEDSDESQRSDSLIKEEECDARDEIFQEISYIESNKPGKCLQIPYIGSKGNKIFKKDKITQKNLLSPIPSFTVPIYRELAHIKPSTVRPSLEEQRMLRNCGKPPRYISKQNSIFEEHDSDCAIYRKERKAFEKQKFQKERPHSSKYGRERIITCLPNERMAPELKYPGEPAKLGRTFTSAVGDEQKLKRPEREHVFGGRSPEIRINSGWRPEVNETVHECRSHRPPEGSADGGMEGKGIVREKLVYVVEEKGKDITKLETDLFTVNEILAIKKDLLELSEFAQKLKRLKEMKKQSENGKSQQNSCHCKPAAELLKDVNKRIEALEARQEELEKGTKFLQKLDVQADSKENRKASTGFQSKTPEVTRASAMTSVPSFPKTDVFVSRAEAFSNNSDIVNELMDIKTQLQMLEKKRMLKESSEAVAPTGDRPFLREDHTIAVFSSSTYILTSENLTKKKEEAKAIQKEEEKANSYMPSAEDKARCEETKAHVVNWLKNISPKTGEKEGIPFSKSKGERRKEISLADMKRAMDLRCRNCDEVLKQEDLKNQEPQKNRASKTETGQGDSLLEVKSPKKQFPKFKECFVTASGRIFARLSKSSEMKPLPVFFCNKIEKPQKDPPLKNAGRSVSSSSTLSGLLTNNEVQKIKPKASKSPFIRVIRSKSLQLVSECSTVSKIEKTARNTNLKNLEKKKTPPSPKEKKRKEDKNEYVKGIEKQLMALTKSLGKTETATSSCTGSEFMASADLENETSETTGTNEFQSSTGNATTATYAATVSPNNIFDETLELQSDEDTICKETKKERKKRNKREEKKRKEEKKRQEKMKKLEKKCLEERKKREKELKHRKKSCSSEEKHRKKDAISEAKKRRKRSTSEEKRRKKEEKKANKKKKKCTCQKCKGRPRLVKRISSECTCGFRERRQRTLPKCVVQRIPDHNDCCSKSTLKENDSQECLPLHFVPAMSADDVSLGRKSTKVTRGKKMTQDFVSDECALKHVLKNFGRFYLRDAPRCKSCEYEDDDDDVDEYRSRCSSHKPKRHHKNHPFQKDDCRCVRAYMQSQSQSQRGWSGMRNLKKCNAESDSERFSSRTEESNRTQDLVFSRTKPQVYYSEPSSTRKKKEKKKEKHKRRKRSKDNDTNDDQDSLCKCKKCGNVHHKDEKQDKDEYSEPEIKKPQTEVYMPPPPPEQPPILCESKGNSRKGDSFPLFSFLNHFCKTKPKEGLAGKISEVRCLKVCSKVKTNRPSTPKRYFRLEKCSPQEKSESEMNESKNCCCQPKIDDIKNRLSQLESKIDQSNKNNARHIKKCYESEDSEFSEPSEASEEKKEKKVKKRKKEKKPKKEKKEKKEKKAKRDKKEKKEKKHKKRKNKKKHKKKKNSETNSDSPESDSTDKEKKCKKKKHYETPESESTDIEKKKKNKKKKHYETPESESTEKEKKRKKKKHCETPESESTDKEKKRKKKKHYETPESESTEKEKKRKKKKHCKMPESESTEKEKKRKKKKHCEMPESESTEKEKKKKKKKHYEMPESESTEKEKKRKNKKHCEMPESESTDKEKKRKNKKHCETPESESTDKEKKRKSKKHCETPESSETCDDREENKRKNCKKTKDHCDDETLAYYHILKRKYPEETPNDSTTKSSKTTTTVTSTTATPTEVKYKEEKDVKEEEPSTIDFKSEEHVKERKCKNLRETMSSLPSFWRNFHMKKMSAGRLEALVNKIRRKKQEGQHESFSPFSFLDDCSKSSPMPKGQEVVEMKPEPSVFMRRLQKAKKSKEKKKREEREREAKKEARSVKSQSKKKRHV